MIVATLTILGPIVAAALILAIRRNSNVLALLGAAVSLVAAVVTLVRVEGGTNFETTLPGLPDFPLRLLADSQTGLLLTVVATVNFLVIVYAVGYMEGEADQSRFFSGMGLFAGAMQALVLAGDWILFLAAWEIIGFASYLLIGFWYERSGVPGSATRAFLVTRTADLGLYAGIAMLVIEAGSSEITETLEVSGTLALVAAIALLIAAMGKSAQVPFHGWLQSAMVGPTPVSAFLHSATLVVAGVILLTRAYPLLTSDARLLIGIAGGVTIVIAGITTLAQRDLKRLLAASTSSQIGFMFLAVGAASPIAALFHLTAHAAMKSALFLGSGIFQHARGTTEFEPLRGIGRGYRRTYLGMVVAGLALAGVPPLAGFWSKEAIVAATFHASSNLLWGSLALVGSLLTGMYVARALRLLWYGSADDENVPGIRWLGVGLAGLAVLAATVGFTGSWIGQLLGGEIPASALSLVLGTSVALLGLAAGWLRPASFWLRSARDRAETGFRLNAGFDGLVVEPVMAFSSALNSIDLGIERGQRAGVRFVSEVGARARIEPALQYLVEGVAHRTFDLGRFTGATDDVGLVGLIGRLVQGTRNLAAQARQLQTGLVHRELVLTAAAALAILIVVIVT